MENEKETKKEPEIKEPAKNYDAEISALRKENDELKEAVRVLTKKAGEFFDYIGKLENEKNKKKDWFPF